MISSITLFSFPPAKFTPNKEESPLNLYNKCLYPTVLITDGNQGGTGFITRSCPIENGKYLNAIITAAHNVDEKRFLKIKVYNYYKSHIVEHKVYDLIIYDTHKTHDLAVGFFVSDKELPTTELSFFEDLQMGTKVFHIGFGLFDDARLDYGIVTQPFSEIPTVMKGLIRTNAYTVEGDSGGPLFLESSNKVIGICRAIRGNQFTKLYNQSYYTNVDNIIKWNLETNNQLESIYKSTINLPKLPTIELELNEYKE